MPRSRNPDSIEAERLWKEENMLLKDIAAKFGVPEGTVRRWKSTQNWEGNKSERSEKTKVKANAKANVRKPQLKVASKTVQESATKVILADNGLTEKQRLFCIYFSKTFNATSSYQKAYGCSYAAAIAAGSRLLTNVKIRDEITRLKEERYTQALLSPDDIFQKYMDIAFADAGDLMSWGREERTFIELDEDGNETPVRREINVVRLKDSNDIDTTLVNEVKQGRDGVTVKLPDRMKALEWLADHMDLATPEQKARTEKIIAETERLRAGQGSDDDDMVLQYIKGMRQGGDPE